MRPTAWRAARAAPARRSYRGLAAEIVPCPCFRSSSVGRPDTTWRDIIILRYRSKCPCVSRTAVRRSPGDAKHRPVTLLRGAGTQAAVLKLWTTETLEIKEKQTLHWAVGTVTSLVAFCCHEE